MERISFPPTPASGGYGPKAATRHRTESLVEPAARAATTVATVLRGQRPSPIANGQV